MGIGIAPYKDILQSTQLVVPIQRNVERGDLIGLLRKVKRKKLWNRLFQKPCFGNYDCLIRHEEEDGLKLWRSCSQVVECCLEKKRRKELEAKNKIRKLLG